MPLFVDGPPSSLQDLCDEDSSLLDVCRTEQIDASKKLRNAYVQISSDLECCFAQQHELPIWHNIDPRLKLNQVVITTSLRSWHVYLTLSLVYRDAYFGQLNDRFQAKWNEYRKLSETAKVRLREVGVGLVLDPLRKPASPALIATPANEVGGLYYFSACLVNAKNEESEPSAVASIQLSNGYAVDVQLASQHSTAIGWNIYAGASPTAIYRQNALPIDLDTDWIYYPSMPGPDHRIPDSGQKPHFYRALPRRLERG